jgi:hypothetical protein
MPKFKILEKAARLWNAKDVSEAEATDTRCQAPLTPAAKPVARRTIPLSPPRTPMLSARCFIQFLQSDGRVGAQPWSGRTGLWQLYLQHCSEDDTTPLPDNELAAALGLICAKRLVRDRTATRRRRLTYYFIPTATEASPMQLEADYDASRPPH